MFIQTPQDLFWLAFALVIFLLGVLLAVVLLYIIKFLREGSRMMASWRQKVERVGEIADMIKEKLMSPGAKAIGLIVGIIKALGIAQKVRNRRKKED